MRMGWVLLLWQGLVLGLGCRILEGLRYHHERLKEL